MSDIGSGSGMGEETAAGMAAVSASLQVRRSRGLYAGWALGEILRHAHRTETFDGLAYLDYVARKGEEDERAAAATIVAHLALVPKLDADAYAAELDRILERLEDGL